MPSDSKKTASLKELEQALWNGMLLREILSSSDSSFDSDDESSNDSGEYDNDERLTDELDIVNALVSDEIEELAVRRYYERKPYRKSKPDRLDDDLEMDERSDDGAPAPWLSPKEFLHKYRMTRESFDTILKLIENHPVFTKANPSGPGRPQGPVAHQLMVLLRYLGTEGGGGCNQSLRNHFGIGRGTVENFKRRVVKAIMSLRKDVIFWPGEAERAQISARIEAQYKFKDCVGLMDGTLFPLRFKPERKDAPDYSGRKFAYSLSTLIVCDDQKLIRYYLAGWPGTAHDNRIFKNSALYLKPANFFSALQYILVDSAYEAMTHIIPSFRKPRGMPIPREHEFFNTSLGKPRVASEHTNGILKGRFPWLKSIPCKLTENVRSLRRILKYIDCCVILHNLLVQHKDHVDVEVWNPGNTSESDDNEDDVNDQEIANDIGLSRPVPSGSHPGTRREQLCQFINSTVVL
jgi:DDE superfamily endonuclease